MRCCFVLLMVCFSVAAQAEQRVLLIVLDGLRPDYVTPEIMPHLHSLSQEGVFFENHHAVYPTVTRVNATSIVTGAYPETHGIMDNTVYFPEVDPKPLSTGSRGNLERIDQATGGKLILVPDLGQILQEAGKHLFVASAGSSGSAFLLNHGVHGGMVIHNNFVLPAEAEAKVLEKLGPAPEEGTPNDRQNHRAMEAYLQFGIDAPVSILWLSDPDHTGHELGIGEPRMMESLRLVDAEVGRMVGALKEKGLTDQVNILVTSDHGFSSYRQKADVGEVVSKFLEEHGQPAENLVVSGNSFYLRGPAKPMLPQLVQRLQETDGVGPMFTAGEPDSPIGSIPGTFSQSYLRIQHPRQADLVVSANWSDEKNERGWEGTTYTDGVAGHGSASEWEVHNTLIASGPAFKRSSRSAVPTCNVDLAPTICYLQGIQAPASMQGRVLTEVLAGAGDPPAVAQRHDDTSASQEGYRARIGTSSLGESRYFDYAQRLEGKAYSRPRTQDRTSVSN